MISGFRKSLRSWATVALLFLALLAIVVTGFGTGGKGGLGALSGSDSPTGDQLATVGGEPITTSAVSEQLNLAYAQARRQIPNLGMAEFLRLNGYEGAVDALINDAAMRQYGEAHGLVVSDQMISAFIANEPTFHDPAGKYDAALFQQYLQQANMSEQALRATIRRELMRRQLVVPMVTGARVPQGVARFYAVAQLEQRRGLIGVMPLGALAQGINPTDGQIAAYYTAHRAALIVPERRVIKYALIGAEQVPPVAATEAEIATVYRVTPRYQQRETRTIQSIVFPSQANADAFARRVRGGTPFLDAARQAGFAPGDVTFANQSQAQFAGVTSSEVAAATFRAAQGAIVGPTRSPLGIHVIRVEAITPIAGQPLAAVRGAIVAEIERRKRGAAIAALAASVQQRLDEGASFEDAARGAHLTIATTPAITATGLQANGEQWAVPAELRPLLGASFDIDADEPEPAVEAVQENARYALLGIDRVDPPAAPPLAAARDRVRNALIREQTLSRARDLANRIAARINAGVPAARAFAEAQPGIPAPQSVEAHRYDLLQRNRQVPAPLLALFRIRPHSAEAVALPDNGGWTVVAAGDSVPGDAAAAARGITSVQQQLTQIASDELQEQLLRAIVGRASVQRNEAAIQAQRRALLGNLAPVD